MVRFSINLASRKFLMYLKQRELDLIFLTAADRIIHTRGIFCHQPLVFIKYYQKIR